MVQLHWKILLPSLLKGGLRAQYTVNFLLCEHLKSSLCHLCSIFQKWYSYKCDYSFNKTEFFRSTFRAALLPGHQLFCWHSHIKSKSTIVQRSIFCSEKLLSSSLFFFSVLAFIFAMLLTCQVHCVEREISFLVKTFGFHKKWIMRLSNPIVKSIEWAMRDFFHSSVVNWGNTSQVHRKCTFRSVILRDWKSAYS